MRLLLLVFGLFLVSLPVAMAGEGARAAAAGESPRAGSEKQPELRAPPGKLHFRCAKKIALGPDKSEIACLMKKHNGFAGSLDAKPAPAQREASGRERDRDRRQPGRH